MAQFDAFAQDYQKTLDQGLAASGENSAYFLRARIAWLHQCLKQLGQRPTSCLDYGCGIGAAAPEFLRAFDLKALVGVDVSRAEIEVARRNHAGPKNRFMLLDEFQPGGDLELAYTNGVFHHIEPARRLGALGYIHASLRVGGLFAFWENNPWNPGTRYVMGRVPFDRDAMPLTARQARRLLRSSGFEILHTRFLFIFPRFLCALRFLEPVLAPLPLGAQYQVLCRKAKPSA